MEITTLLSGAVLGAFVTGAFTIFSKYMEYKNSYLKMIVEKRVIAYEKLDVVIQNLKIAVVDNDAKPYHQILTDKKSFFDFLQLIHNTMAQEFWMSDNTKSLLLKLHQKLISYIFKNEQGIEFINIGKDNYKQIGIQRDELEKSILKDFPNIYKVKSFFKAKQIVTEFENRDISK